MLETGRRSAISTSELGLYSDRGDRYSRSRCGLIARKLAIGVMVVVTVILVAIFIYDFTSATSVNSKVNQETKHIYILQNALKKSSNLAKKSANSTILPEAMVNRTDDFSMEDRSDNENYENPNAIPMQRNIMDDMTPAESRIVRPSGPEMRAQNLQNFKQRKRVLKSMEDTNENDEEPEGKFFDNHAIVYRVRQRYKYPDSDEDASMEEARPTPFHWEFKTPHPTSFKRPRYPQLSQYRYPQSSRNIQDIIKYLTNNDMPNRGIKFSGVYVSPKKYDLIPGMGEMMSSSDKTEEEDEAPFYPINSHNNDPFYQYKPKHPADVNLLATSNVRFSPTGFHRYNPYYDPLYSRPLYNYNKPVVTEPQYADNIAYSTSTLGKNRKPKPFSVMLDIYPITDIMEQNKKTSRPRPQGSAEDYDSRRPLQFNRAPPKFYPSSPQPIPLVAVPSPTTLSEEEERQQMIFHLNLYPRKKNKLNRHDIIHRSESMQPEERQLFAKKIMSPLESIAKHLTVHSALEESQFEDRHTEVTSLPLTRYQEINLDDKENENERRLVLDNDSEIYPDSNNEDGSVETTVPPNHKLNIDDDYASTEKYETDAQKIVVTTTKRNNANCTNSTTVIDSSKANANGSVDLSKDIDTIEGFQRFSHGLLRSD